VHCQNPGTENMAELSQPRLAIYPPTSALGALPSDSNFSLGHRKLSSILCRIRNRTSDHGFGPDVLIVTVAGLRPDAETRILFLIAFT
jgi:hypothetical protein